MVVINPVARPYFSGHLRSSRQAWTVHSLPQLSVVGIRRMGIPAPFSNAPGAATQTFTPRLSQACQEAAHRAVDFIPRGIHTFGAYGPRATCDPLMAATRSARAAFQLTLPARRRASVSSADAYTASRRAFGTVAAVWSIWLRG